MKTLPNNIPQLSLAAFSAIWLAILCSVAVFTRGAFVFSDEAGYLLPILFGTQESNYARWSILAAYPSYLYFWLYSFLPVSEIHTTAKLLNALFIVAAAFPAYRLGKQYLTAGYAAAFAAMVIISPVSSFVRYVMPESVYFFGFWMTLWLLLSLTSRSALFAAVVAGGLCGLLSLIKPHAFAVSLALSIFFLIRDRFGILGAILAAGQLVTYYVMHILIEWSLTGVWSLSVIGSSYGGMLSAPRIDVPAAAFNLAGHVLAIIVLIAIPFEIAVLYLIRNLIRGSPASSEAAKLNDLALLACCLLGAMVAMTVYFSQSVYQINPVSEKISRLHGRYYFYVLPLFWLFLLGMWHSGLHAAYRPVLIRNLYLGGVLVFVAAYLIWSRFDVGPVDFSDLTLLHRWKALVFLLSVAMVGIGLYVLTRVHGSLSDLTKLVSGTVMWWAALTVLTTAALLAGRSFFHVDPIGIAFLNKTNRTELHELVGRSDGVTVGTSESAVDVYRAMFYLRSLSAGLILNPGRKFQDTDFPSNARWAVLMPDVHYSGSGRLVQLGALSVVLKHEFDR